MNDRSEPGQARFKRRPLLALFLNGLMMGLGHLYVGRARRALLFFFLLASLQLALFLAIFLAPPSSKLAVFMPGFGLLAAAHILGMLDAFGLARRLGPDAFGKQWFNRVPVYLAYFVAGALLSYSLAGMERRHLVNIYRVSSSSMSPTLQSGDYVLTNQQFDCLDCGHELAPGDIVVFEQDGSIWVKRIVGLPGDEVRLENQILSVNGVPLRRVEIDELGSAELERFHELSHVFEESLGAHSYLTAWDPLKGHSTETARVPANALYLLGDNRNRSKDSRQLGFALLTSVRGRVDQIWFSRHQRAGWRAERSGISFPSPSSLEDER